MNSLRGVLEGRGDERPRRTTTAAMQVHLESIKQSIDLECVPAASVILPNRGTGSSKFTPSAHSAVLPYYTVRPTVCDTLVAKDPYHYRPPLPAGSRVIDQTQSFRLRNQNPFRFFHSYALIDNHNLNSQNFPIKSLFDVILGSFIKAYADNSQIITIPYD